MEKDVLVGVNYFAGWWEPLPNKWHAQTSSQSAECGEDWRPRYPERVPLLGCFNDQETMNQELIAAANHGVDFFQILWYYNEPGQEREPNARFLEQGLLCFLNSPEAWRMNFFIEFCNHPPFEVTTEAQWRQCLECWITAMAHPSYLRIGGRLVLKVHGAEHFAAQNANDLQRCQRQLDLLRQAVRDAGLGEMLIGGGVMATDQIDQGHPVAKLFDFTCTYMDVPPVPKRPENYPYEQLADLARTARYVHAGDAVPYVPYLAAGWCPRPWPDERAYFHFPAPQQWALELRRMGEDLAFMANLGFPLSDGSLQKAFTIYAWNEFGEGGIVAPNFGDRYMKLEEIKSAFGIASEVSPKEHNHGANR